MSTEEALFGIWFHLNRKSEWDSKYPGEPMPKDWGMGNYDAMLKGWLARAGAHMSFSKDGINYTSKSPDFDHPFQAK